MVSDDKIWKQRTVDWISHYHHSTYLQPIICYLYFKVQPGLLHPCPAAGEDSHRFQSICVGPNFYFFYHRRGHLALIPHVIQRTFVAFLPKLKEKWIGANFCLAEIIKNVRPSGKNLPFRTLQWPFRISKTKNDNLWYIKIVFATQ